MGVHDDNKVTVHGLKELVASAKAVDKDLPKEMRQINKEAAEMVVPPAKGLVPVLTGNLQASIRAGATARSGTVKAGSSKVPYAAPIHWGWGRRGIKPQPFLVDALGEKQDAIFEKYDRDLSAWLERTFT